MQHNKGNTMYRIGVKQSFSSAHFIKDYKGKCENLHGHNYKVEAFVIGDSLDKAGMLIDFSELKKCIKIIIEKLDHTLLNDLEYFNNNNPSSENIAKFIYDEMRKILKEGITLEKVRIWETEEQYAEYFE